MDFTVDEVQLPGEAGEEKLVREDKKTGARFQTINALLLALVTVLGAFVAWRASVAADASGDAGLDGLIATLNAEETRALNTITLHENYRAYTGYTRYNELGYQLEAELEKTQNDAEAEQLEQEMRNAWDTAEAFYFPRRYLNRDGTYNADRELGEAWAEAAREKDLSPEPHFQEANRMQAKSNWLVVVVTVLAMSLLAHTLAETLESPRLKISLLVLGVVLMLAGLSSLLALEYVIYA